jgi:hypothetical protein
MLGASKLLPGLKFMLNEVRTNIGLANSVIVIWGLTLLGCGSSNADATSKVIAPIAASDLGARSQAAAAPPSKPVPQPKPRPGARTKVLARAGDRSYDKTFDDLRFEMTVDDKFTRSMLTQEIEALHGQKIRIRGYILPTPQNHGIKQFVLVRDNQECCFGPGAALYDCILVEMKSGKTADFTIRPIAIEGEFEIREFVIDGKHLAIYHVDADSAG